MNKKQSIQIAVYTSRQINSKSDYYKFSSYLLYQIFEIKQKGHITFEDKKGEYVEPCELNEILQKIKAIKTGQIKPEPLFKNPSLKGLYKCHFNIFSINSVSINMLNENGFWKENIITKEFPNGKVKYNEKLAYKRLDEILKKLNIRTQKSLINRKKDLINKEDLINNLAKINHEQTIGAYKRRQQKKKIKGEWIIIAKYNNTLYFLGLAIHNNDDILKELKTIWLKEFPELKNIF